MSTTDSFAFRLKPGATLDLREYGGGVDVQLGGDLDSSFVQGFSPPTDFRDTERWEYEITVKAKRKFVPGYYRYIPGLDGANNHCTVRWYDTPPWKAETGAKFGSVISSNWQRVEVKPV